MHSIVNKAAAVCCIALITAVLLCGLLLAGTASANPGTSISIAPSTQTVSQGDSFTFDVVISTDVATRGAEVSLSWDPSLIRIDNITEGTYYSDWGSSNGGADTDFNPGTINNVIGDLKSAGVAILGGNEGGATGSGTFIQIHGTALATGSGITLGLYNVKVADSNALPITGLETNDGTVTVSGAAEPTSTPTQTTPPAATATPTSTSVPTSTPTATATSQPTATSTPGGSSSGSSGTPWGMIGGGIGALAVGAVIVAAFSMKRQGGKGKSKGDRSASSGKQPKRPVR